ncbi:MULTISPECIES: hypothetical protein [Arcobacteraceae]|uniref:Carrier domain-containing protein n=4 Tax=Arcobacteraceae TaxID=2808963 RepID=A0AAW6VN68_9BACT|nr:MULTISPECIES: hypothetical protein [Arcobacteraceae]KLE09504.1 hypothetical protein AF80_06755 [Aliarcobacter butzleri L355]MCT7582044.1 hypothetical protein [Aliarcobacter butzleri]MDK2062265.1 hypothetical protein [Aliarcobacter butzleri]MDN5064709.1 hypothetical protein [Aliarcobacter butzleri]MDN5067123.1 hypothetical protein [Aliarcobacter butzleri]
MSLEKIENIIIESLKEYNQSLGSSELKNCTAQTRLYGEKSVLDSIGLVYLITDIEEKISDKFSKNIVLADEKAMSQRTSPFRDVETLAKYIQNLLEE